MEGVLLKKILLAVLLVAVALIVADQCGCMGKKINNLRITKKCMGGEYYYDWKGRVKNNRIPVVDENGLIMKCKNR